MLLAVMRKNQRLTYFAGIPICQKVWEDSGVKMRFWAGQFKSMRDYIEFAMEKINRDKLGILCPSVCQQAWGLVQSFCEVNVRC